MVHILENLAHDVDKTLAWWPEFLPGLKSLVNILHNDRLRQRFVASCVLNTGHHALKDRFKQQTHCESCRVALGYCAKYPLSLYALCRERGKSHGDARKFAASEAESKEGGEAQAERERDDATRDLPLVTHTICPASGGLMPTWF